MKLPREVKILFERFEIVELCPSEEDFSGVHGDCDVVQRRIRVAVHGQSFPRIKDTLRHEISHAAYELFGLEQGDSEERIVKVMSSAWTHIAEENPELMRWLDNHKPCQP